MVNVQGVKQKVLLRLFQETLGKRNSSVINVITNLGWRSFRMPSIFSALADIYISNVVD
jgi:hypothetical protein